MSAKLRGKSHPRPLWVPLGEVHDHGLRRVALRKADCKVCGGIAADGRVKVVHHRSGKAWWWHMCGPCRDRLHRGELRNTMGVV